MNLRYYPVGFEKKNTFLLLIQKFLASPISSDVREMYEKNCEIYEKIKNQSIREYSYWLEDVEFAIENIEWELAKVPTSKAFWIFYLQFLFDKRQIMVFLKVISRYCRLFIDDYRMRRNYELILEMISKDSKPAKFWIDLIEIERLFGNISTAFDVLKKAQRRHEIRDTEILLKYSQWFIQKYTKDYMIWGSLFSKLICEFSSSDMVENISVNQPAKIVLWDEIIIPKMREINYSEYF